MEVLKLSQYREQNRQIGWRATADIIAQHIITQSQEPLDFDILIKRVPADYKIDPVTRCKVRDIVKYLDRINTAFFIIMYSFDDSREDAVACYRHLFHHHCVIANWRNMDGMDSLTWLVYRNKLISLPGYIEFRNRYEDLVKVDGHEPENIIDSRFH